MPKLPPWCSSGCHLCVQCCCCCRQACGISLQQHNVDLLSIELLVELIKERRHIETEEVAISSEARVKIAPYPFAKGKNRLVSAEGGVAHAPAVQARRAHQAR